MATHIRDRAPGGSKALCKSWKGPHRLSDRIDKVTCKGCLRLAQDEQALKRLADGGMR